MTLPAPSALQSTSAGSQRLVRRRSDSQRALRYRRAARIFSPDVSRSYVEYRNPQHPGQSSLGIAYIEAEQYKIVRPDFLFFAKQGGKVVVDLVDPHGLHLADALPKLQGLALYAETHAACYRRMVSVAETKGNLRALDLTREEVRKAIAAAKDAATLFSGALAQDY